MRLLAVNYHYYRTELPTSGIHPITPRRFSEQISQLTARWKIVSELEFVSGFNAGDTRENEFCLITFDDGLKEQMKAIRWLVSQGLSAVCYVPTAPVIERRVLDVHKIHIIRTLGSDIDLSKSLSMRFGAAFSKMDLGIASHQYPYDSDDARRVKYFLNFILAPDARSEWVDEIFCRLAGDEEKVVEELYMDRDDLRELAQYRMLGTHGHAHLPLAGMNAKVIQADIGHSLDVIEDITGLRVRGISYPYGGTDAHVGSHCGSVWNGFRIYNAQWRQ